MSDKRGILKEWVRGVLKEAGDSENVPGGVPAPGAGLGPEGDGIVVRSITDNGFEIADDDSHAFTLVTVTGEIGGKPFVSVERVPLTVSEEEDFDEESGRKWTDWVGSVDDGEFVSFKVDGIEVGEEERDYALSPKRPGGVEFNKAFVKYLHKLEARFQISGEFRDIVDNAKESASYSRDPYKYYGVKRSDFY